MMLNNPDSSKGISEFVEADSSTVASSVPLELQLNGGENEQVAGAYATLDMFRSMRSDILGNSAEDSPLMSPQLVSPVASQHQIVDPAASQQQQPILDQDTQMSMVQQAAGLHLSDTKPCVTNGTNCQLRIFDTDTDDDQFEISRKVLKVDNGSDASTAFSHADLGEDTDKGFENSSFEFMKFGFAKPSDSIELSSSPVSSTKPNDIMCGSESVFFDELTQHSMAGTAGPVITIAPSERKEIKEPPLNMGFSARGMGCEIKVLNEPEEQHRARYQTEGSRGAVKDRSGQSHPRVQLLGCNQPVTLQVYIGSDNSKFKPHGFYQACKVSGNKSATPCSERDIEGTTVIEVQLEPSNDMIALIDCVGILKLRNSDVQQRIGLSRSKKKSTKARMIFRVNIPKPNGTCQTLQVASSQILCTQPTGTPEICRMSLSSCCLDGGQDLFIIGKNFLKGTKVQFQEKLDDEFVKWEAEASVDSEYFQATHMIATVPPYKGATVGDSVEVFVVVSCGGRNSEGTPFTYTSNGIKSSPVPGILQNEVSLFGTSTTEHIFNDPGGTDALTFKVEPDAALTPDLPAVTLDDSVPMDTGDGPPSKMTKISECVSPEAEKLAQEFIVQSSQKNNSSNALYSPEPLNVNNEGSVNTIGGNMEHMETEAALKNTSPPEHRTSLKSPVDSVETVDIIAVKEELSKLMSQTYQENQSSNPSNGTNTPISPGRAGDRYNESVYSSPFASPDSQLQSPLVVDSNQINLTPFSSPTQASPSQLNPEIYSSENQSIPTFSLPQQIQVEQITNSHTMDNESVTSGAQEMNPDVTGGFILGNTPNSESEPQSQMKSTLNNTENVVNPSLQTIQELPVKPDHNIFNNGQNPAIPQPSFSTQGGLDNLLATLCSDLINVTQQSPFDGTTSSLDTEMPPNVSVEDIPDRDKQFTLPISVQSNPANPKADIPMQGVVPGEFHVNTSSLQAVSGPSSIAEAAASVNYFLNSTSETGVKNELQTLLSQSLPVTPLPTVSFVSEIDVDQQMFKTNAQAGTAFIPSTEALNQPEMQVQNVPTVVSSENSVKMESVAAGHSAAKSSESTVHNNQLLTEVLMGVKELCGLLKQTPKQEPVAEGDVERTKESLMSSLPDKSMQLMEVLQNQIKDHSNQTNHQTGVGGLLQEMLQQQQLQKQQSQVQTLGQEVQTPGQQVQTPGQQMQTPHQQVQIPHQQVQTPHQQVQTPHQQVQTPLQQVQTPHQQNSVKNNGGQMIVTSSVNTIPSIQQQVENYPQVKVINTLPVIQNGTIQNGMQVVSSNSLVIPQSISNHSIGRVIKQPNGQPLRFIIDQAKSGALSQGAQMANIANITALVPGSTQQKTNIAAASFASSPITTQGVTFVPLNSGQCQALKFLNVNGNQPIMIANQSPGASGPITFVRGNPSSTSVSTGSMESYPDISEGVNIKNGLLAQLLTQPTSSLETLSVAQSSQQPENMDVTSTKKMGQL